MMLAHEAKESGKADLVAVAGDLSNEYKCPNGCEGAIFVEDTRHGDIICQSCGTVLPERYIDPGREWRDFQDSDQDRSRIGMANEFLKDGIGTHIASLKGGTTGGMSKAQSRLVSNIDRNVTAASERIDNFSHLLKLTDKVTGAAKKIYMQFEEKRSKATRYKTDAIIAAIVYMACKEEGLPRTFKEISRSSDIEEKEIRKYYKAVNKILNRQNQRISAANLVDRFCSHLGWTNGKDYQLVSSAREVAEKAMHYLEGKSPSSIAAASILLVARRNELKTSEKDIAEAAAISHTTIRNVYKELLPHSELLLPARKGATAATAAPGAGPGTSPAAAGALSGPATSPVATPHAPTPHSSSSVAAAADDDDVSSDSDLEL